MRPGQLRELTYRAVLDYYELLLCDGSACARGWSVYKHDICSYDRMGHIHWSKADVALTRRGLRRLLVAIGGIELKHNTRSIPTWQKLYEANVWAWAEGMRVWHVQFTQEMSKADRMRAYRLAGNEVRKINEPAYQWMRGRKKNWR